MRNGDAGGRVVDGAFGSPERSSTTPLLVFLLLAAAVLRFWGIAWALPLKKAHIDEGVVIFYAMRFLTGDLNPHVFFDYPTLFLYLLAAVFFSCFLAGRLGGAFGSLDQFVGFFLNGDASFLYLAARSLTVLFALATVYLVYRLARENLSVNPLIPAAVLAVSPLHVLHSHYATADVAAVLFVTLAALFAGRYRAGGKVRDLHLAALALGLGTATKYYPVVFFLPLVAAVFLKERRVFARRTVAAAALLAAGFVAGCPYSVLDFPAFSARFSDRFGYIVGGAGAVADGESFRFAGIAEGLLSGFTPPLLVALLCGMAAAFLLADATRRKTLLFWSSFPALYLVFLACWRIVAPHYVMPVLPFLALIGAEGWAGILSRMRSNRVPLKVTVAAAGAFSGILAAAPVARDVQIGRLLSREDTRLAALAWARENIPARSRVLRFASTPEFSPADPFAVRVDWENRLTDTPPAALAREYDYLISAENMEGRDGFSACFVPVRRWDAVPLAPFHHPRITVYRKRS